MTVSPNSLTAVSAYVQQDDLFIGTLTVREHLNFQVRTATIPILNTDIIIFFENIYTFY